jgi:hypothetical protein
MLAMYATKHVATTGSGVSGFPFGASAIPSGLPTFSTSVSNAVAELKRVATYRKLQLSQYQFYANFRHRTKPIMVICKLDANCNA